MTAQEGRYIVIDQYRHEAGLDVDSIIISDHGSHDEAMKAAIAYYDGLYEKYGHHVITAITTADSWTDYTGAYDGPERIKPSHRQPKPARAAKVKGLPGSMTGRMARLARETGIHDPDILKALMKESEDL